jgi:hypothetical protein
VASLRRKEDVMSQRVRKVVDGDEQAGFHRRARRMEASGFELSGMLSARAKRIYCGQTTPRNHNYATTAFSS